MSLHLVRITRVTTRWRHAQPLNSSKDVRAICDLPLGDTTPLSPVVMVNLLGQHLEEAVRRFGEHDALAESLGVVPKLHLYGKSESKLNRKMGHINLLCGDVDDALEWVEKTNIWRQD